MTEEERYKALEQEKQNSLNTANQTYQDLLDKNQEFTNTYNQNLQNQQQIQSDILDKQTAWQVELQNQNKEKAEREYQQEATASKNAYYDFVNPYGVQAEIQANNGLQGSGYSESVKAQAWTTQQNRTAQAKASLNNAKLQFDNAIKEAYLNNDTNKAQLALQILQAQQQETLRSFNYQSDINLNKLNNTQNISNEYFNRYNTLYNQIQNEKATQEAIRQWETEMKFKQDQAKQDQANWEKQYALSSYNTYNSGNNSSSSNGGYDLSGISNNVTQIKTDYFQGDINPDTQYGTFGTKDKNGVAYQPNNIGGVPLKSSGKKVSQITGDKNFKNSSGVNVANQTVWQIGNQYYIWNGSKNKYEKLSTK